MEEQWRIIPGFGNYAVSDRKRVKNLTTGRIIGHPNNCTPGAKDVALLRSDDGKYKMFTKDRLHGMCFGYQLPTEPGEEWRRVDDYPGIAVSNLGRVWSDWYCDLLPGSPGGKGGYLTITHKKKDVRVHRLVALAFVHNDDPDNKNEVDHINENKQDNRAANLRWCTTEENLSFYSSRHYEGGAPRNLSAHIGQDK